MAEPFGILGAVALLIQSSFKVAGYIKSVKGSSSDRQRLLSEINSTVALCQTLQDFVEMNGEKDWASTLKLLNDDNGPIAQLQGRLDQLENKLALSSEKDDRMKALKWPFDKKETQDVLALIERQKSLFQIAQQNDHLRLSLAIQSDTQDIARGVSTLVLDQEDQKKKALLSRLTPIDFDIAHRDINSRRVKETGKWLLESPEYTLWLEQPSTLWCRGIPGAGKTILSSLVIQTLRENHLPEVGVAGLYCSYRSPETILNMLGSLVKQLAEPLADLPVPLQNLTVPGLEDFRSILSEVFSCYSKVMIVIDALDECVHRIELLKELNEFIQQKQGTQLHILIMSRSGIVDIERGLKASIRLEIRSHDDDAQVYLRHRLREHQPISDWVTESPDFEVLIEKAIMKRMHGMFLLARLYMDLLIDIPTRRGVRKALETLPDGPEDTYTEAWARICAQRPQYAELGKKTLSWLVHATRPLRIRELLHALAIDEDDEEFDEEGLSDISTLTSSCAGLVVLDEQQGFVSLVHPTAQEYFQERKNLLFPNGHEDIAKTCITYLLMRIFRETGPLFSLEELTKRWSNYPFLGYAAVNWGHHVKLAESKKIVLSAARLLENDKARVAAKQALVLNLAGAQSWGTEWPGQESTEQLYITCSMASLGAIHLAAYFGLDNIVDGLISVGEEVDARDENHATAIFWALYGHQNGVLKRLLKHGADANAFSDHTAFRRWLRLGGMSVPLRLAAYQGNIAAVRLLLQYGADVNGGDPNGGSMSMAVSTALWAQQDDVVSVLLDNGADVNFDGVDFISNASLDLLKKIVAAGLNKKNIQQALHEAAAQTHYEKVKFFLDHGADANGPYFPREDDVELYRRRFSKNDEVFTPLIKLIAHELGSADQVPRVLNLLIDSGADVNRVAACHYFYTNDFFLLRSTGGFAPNHGRKTTPLMTAAYHGMTDVVKILIERGALVNLIVDGTDTALTSAVESESYQLYSIDTYNMIKLLIQHGADPKLCDIEAENRIQKLLAMSSEERKLLSTFQNLVRISQFGEDIYNDERRTYRERRLLLDQLIKDGADPGLCCSRDEKIIYIIMGWTEEELEEFDLLREEKLDEMKRYKRGPMF